LSVSSITDRERFANGIRPQGSDGTEAYYRQLRSCRIPCRAMAYGPRRRRGRSESGARPDIAAAHTLCPPGFCVKGKLKTCVRCSPCFSDASRKISPHKGVPNTAGKPGTTACPNRTGSVKGRPVKTHPYCYCSLQSIIEQTNDRWDRGSQGKHRGVEARHVRVQARSALAAITLSYAGPADQTRIERSSRSRRCAPMFSSMLPAGPGQPLNTGFAVRIPHPYRPFPRRMRGRN